MELNKNKSVILKGGNYTITFPKGTMNETSQSGGYNFGICLDAGDYYQTIRKLPGKDFVLSEIFEPQGRPDREEDKTIESVGEPNKKNLGTQKSGDDTGEGALKTSKTHKKSKTTLWLLLIIIPVLSFLVIYIRNARKRRSNKD